MASRGHGGNDRFQFSFSSPGGGHAGAAATGEIGTPLGVRAVLSIIPHATPAWKQTRVLGGGALLDLASHHVDLVHYLFDEPVVRAWASVRSLRSEGDHAWLEIELASGARAQLFVSLGSVDEHRMEIVGTAGKLVMDRTELLRAAFVGATLRGARVHRLRRALSALDPRLLIRSPGVEPSFRARWKRLSAQPPAAISRDRICPTARGASR